MVSSALCALIVQLVLVEHVICAQDTDKDGIIDAKDSCPFDPDNDKDGDNMCALEICRDDPKFVVPLSGAKCSHQGAHEHALRCSRAYFPYASSLRPKPTPLRPPLPLVLL